MQNEVSKRKKENLFIVNEAPDMKHIGPERPKAGNNYYFPGDF